MVPRLAPDGLEARLFLKFLRAGANKNQFALARQYHEMTAGQQQLAVTVATVLPLAASGRRIDTSEDSLIESIHEAIPEDRAVELVLEILVLPHLTRAET